MKKILIMGLTGSGKSTLAEPFARLIGGVYLKADTVRQTYKDQDFGPAGRQRQAQRMRHLADGIALAGRIAVIDFDCVTEADRQAIDADYVVWLDTIKENNTNLVFEKPARVDYHVSAWFEDTHEQLFKVIKDYFNKENTAK